MMIENVKKCIIFKFIKKLHSLAGNLIGDFLCSLNSVKGYEGSFILLRITSHRLAQNLLTACNIKNIINNLESKSKSESVFCGSIKLSIVSSGADTAHYA